MEFYYGTTLGSARGIIDIARHDPNPAVKRSAKKRH